jgi:hypothetical protein
MDASLCWRRIGFTALAYGGIIEIRASLSEQNGTFHVAWLDGICGQIDADIVALR